ncbi:MAG: hypothetical protein JO233_06960 [Candidatus Eremiobacteraeota bacterium]|nr:hypothetical protein [Candidatus Eremiobacteraeota bacterium]
MSESAQFKVLSDSDIKLKAGEPLRSMYKLSPFAWRGGDEFQILVRAVNRDDDPAKKIARIYHGRSDDGLMFQMDSDPDITPGPDADDAHGCEDPTVAEVNGQLYVYYSGWNQDRKIGKLMMACGPNPCSLQKRGVAISSTPDHQNPKEATIAQRRDGTWVLFFEYARDDRSRIGLATSKDVAGPWQVGEDPIIARDSGWDSWHVSPGPLIAYNGRPLIFYNGSAKKLAWRIGWAILDDEFESVAARGEAPLITPPPPKGEDTDIAFAASAVASDDETWLYYSIADRQMKRAVLQKLSH